MKRFTIYLPLILAALFLVGCNMNDGSIKEPPVTEAKAEEVATEVYDIELISRIGLIELEEDEISAIPFEKAEELTPMYYMIVGNNSNSEEKTIFINSDDHEVHYAN